MRSKSLESPEDARIKVLWVIKSLGPGGAERILCYQARAIDTESFHVECAYITPHLDHFLRDLEDFGVTTHCVARSRRDPWWPVRLLRLIRRGDWDVLHLHSPLPASVARLAIVTMRRSSRPVIVSSDYNSWPTYHPLSRRLNAWTSHRDAATIAVSQEVADSMTGPARQRAFALRHGIDIERIAESRGDRATVRAEFGIGTDEFVVGTAASFTPQKDYPNLLRAAKRLADEHLDIRFLVIGQGPDEDEIVKMRSTFGLDSQVILTGYRHDATRVLGCCDVFVLASAWEGLPVVVTEACALGLPIVATRTGGIDEEFVDEDNALIVPIRDSESLARALGRVYEDADLRSKLAAGALAKAPQFDVRHSQKTIEDVYRSVVTDRSTDAIT